MIKANNPELSSWIEVPAGSDFPIQNLPFGIFKTKSISPRAATAIGDFVVDLHSLHEYGFFAGIALPKDVFAHATLNYFISLGKETTGAVRERLSELLQSDNAELRDQPEAREKAFYRQAEVEMLLPVKVGDYTDFYSSEQHAFNVGSMFRDPDNALLPNWKHIPVGYHGRASSIVVSGVDIRRPKGQTLEPGADAPTFGPTKRLDFELEMAFITGKATQMGDSISVNEAEDYIFGFSLFNDWSARDVQKWEYVPLGPFLAKNFASSISPWIVTLDALDPFRVPGPKQDPKVLPYLEYSGDKNFDINLEVLIQPENADAKRVSLSNFKYMYWNIAQQLAHHTVNGCNINVGDMYASGTISGPTPDSYGSMLELAWKGTKPVPMPDGTERKFIHDGDTVIMRGFAEKDGVRIGFGEVKTKVLPAT
ncbi:fumarylacetoacetase [Marinoscillum furvescens]|uniref:fumarylacetoacetase n=1 Tax=Marinoscillum furvescens DSM 4134 TaxID=1122208 RepID=A0A3D9L7G5_MARFU|nr:fumarylacetoacetase [Marinoscillum furvescens]REE01250.1 fumarylacetoacetate hydrolase [Marinoscillum furvescens DSM 4134]